MVEKTTPTIATRFLIISDTHNFEFKDNADSSPLALPLPRADVVLHCGDLTHCGGASSYKKALKLLGAFDAELKLVIAGNHDLDLDREYWKCHLEEGDEEEDHCRAVEIMTGLPAAEAGVTYLEEGTYTFALESGARFTIYASPYSSEFCDWAFAYKHKEDRFNGAHQVADGIKSIAAKPVPGGIDIVMTHGPPKGILDESSQGSVGCENLLHAVRRARPRLHCFGHIHEANGMMMMDWDAGEDGENGPLPKNSRLFRHEYPKAIKTSVAHGEKTLMVNAAIMD